MLISVPGRYAAGVAREALELGKHVFLYSDNVSLEDEIALKKTAREKGLLVMGPDCGTAIINGIGLGFANRVRRGGIGVVGASGTGTQAVTSHIHELGGGISHAIGTGGRDLKSDVGAITAHQALDLLHAILKRKSLCLFPNHLRRCATQLISAAQGTGKPIVVYFIGYPPPARKIGNLQFAISLSEAEISTRIEDSRIDNSPILKCPFRSWFVLRRHSCLRNHGWIARLFPPVLQFSISDSQISDPLHSRAHTIIDLGDEFFMVGRLHPDD